MPGCFTGYVSWGLTLTVPSLGVTYVHIADV